LINPGGPGGPGALFTVLVGQSLQDIVDPEVNPDIRSADLKYYDILGFDPRGIGETEPAANCMADRAASWSWTLREDTEGILGSSDAALGRLWSMSHAWGTSCKQAMDAEDGPDIKQYMATAFVARDMLEIVEKHATYVSESLDLLKTSMPRSYQPDTTLYKPEEAKLQYWGFSYGTYLGSTFASMFPDRVGRVILDGVVSSYDYNHSLGNGSLVDNQKAMDSFYTYCIHSGPEACPLTTSNSTLADVKNRVEKIMQSLYHHPLAINSPTGPEILTYSDVKKFLFSACYSPRAAFPLVATLLVAIEAGHGDILDQLRTGYQYTHIYTCPINGSQPAVDYTSTVPTFAILCSDSIDQSHMSIDEFVTYWELLESMSPTAGAVWSTLSMRCASWKIKASYKYEGEFGANTSHPILFLSNTADPVTPLKSGRFMHGLFPNSGILVSDQAGHCSVSSPDLCTMGHVRQYFQTGVLPPQNTLCVPKPGPFSLNSTDPGSPFYNPDLGDMVVEETVGMEKMSNGQQVLQSAGWIVASKIVESDLFGAGRLVGGSNRLGKEVMKIAAEEWMRF
jgi:pimeloyl-ACP methyl ester carboxylesterase